MTRRLVLHTTRTAGLGMVLAGCPRVPDPACGYKLPNGTIIATSDDTPSVLYKFTPWTQTLLAFNEVDAYAHIQLTGGVAGLVKLLGISGTETHFVRALERSTEGELGQFLLRHTRAGGQRGSAFARPLLAQLARTMAGLHALQLVHRDLKAENVLVFTAEPGTTGAVRVKLSDLDRCVELPANQTLNTPVGSLFHMAPELLDGRDYDRKVDVYAFGILMFEVVHAGARPYPQVANCMPDSIPRDEFIARVIADVLRPAWTDDDPALAALAERCWATVPEERPEFEEILACLDAPPTRHDDAPQPAANSDIGGIDGVGTASHIGKVRTSQEDAVCVLQADGLRVAAVFDGTHGGDTSEFLARQMPLVLAHALTQHDAEAALRKTFAVAEATLRAIDPPLRSGSTAVVALIEQGTLWLAWTGDSPACLYRHDAGEDNFSATLLVNRHQPARADEAARAIAQGGIVGREQQWLDNGEAAPFGPLRVYAPASERRGGIALTRALGLFAFKPVLSAEPEITRQARQADDLFLLLGTDGIFDYLSTDAMHTIISSARTMQQAADALIAAVLQAGAPDNASVALIDLRAGVVASGLNEPGA